MIRVLGSTALAIVLFGILLSVPASGQISLITNCEPYGSVNYNGQPAPDNMVVIAYVGDFELGRCFTASGQYSIVIPLDNPDTPQRDGYRATDIITMRVNGNIATPSFEAFAGHQRRNIDVILSDIQTQTWGQIKALFR